MPITVKHDTGGGDISGLLMLAAAAGGAQANVPGVTQQIGIQGGGGGGGGGGGRIGRSSIGASRDRFAAQAAELQATRDNQMRQIDADADMQKQSADDAMKKVAIQQGMDKEMKDQEYDREVKRMQEQAKADAQKFKWGFSPDVKRRMAKDNMERQAIQDAVEERRISPEQGEAEIGKINARLDGYQATAQPADPDAPPSLEEQIKVVDGETWVPSSSGPRYIPFKTTKAGYEAEQEKASEKLQYDAQQAKFDARSKMLTDAVSAKFKDFSGGGEVPATSKQVSDMMAEYDKQIAEYEIRDAVQRQAASGGDMGGVDARNEAARVNAKQQWDEQHAAPGMGGAPAPQTKPWNAELEEKGIDVGGLKIPVKVTAEQAQLPPEQGAQLAMFDSLYKKYPKYDDVPAELRPAYVRLLEFAEQYYGGK